MSEQNTILDLVGSVPIGVILVGANRQVISLNRMAREITRAGDALEISNNQLFAAAGVRRNGITTSMTSRIAHSLRTKVQAQKVGSVQGI